MWKRNLLFFAVILGAAGVLSANLSPAPRPDSAGKRKRPQPLFIPPPIVASVDQTFRDQWREEKFTPAPRAADLTLFRRLSLALKGAIPSLEEIRAFEAAPPQRRLSDWLDRTLRDRPFADYFAERLARAYVGTENGPFLLYRRRRFLTWLSDALIENRPYDRMVRQMISGNGIWTDQPSTNFISVTIDQETKAPDPERLAARSARAFLGVRLDCAQCHDHPFQPWKQADFQGIAAFYGKVRNGFQGIQEGPGAFSVTNRKTGKLETIEPRVPFLPDLWTQHGSRREQLAEWITHPKNAFFSRAIVNRCWALMFNRPLVEPVDDLPSAGDPPRVLELLADDFQKNGYDLRRLIQIIASTEVFALDSATPATLSEGQDVSWSIFPLTRLRPEQVAGSVFQTASVETIDRDSHILVRIFRYFGENNFVNRFGDIGNDEFAEGSGTIPQRLIMMNGELVDDKTKNSPFNAATRISTLAADDPRAVETAYLTILTRRPTPEESAHFEPKLRGKHGDPRHQAMADLFWTLVNSTEFSWNH